MLLRIQRFIEKTFTDESAGEADHERAIHLAAAGLMVEVMRADFDISETEREAISELVSNHFDLKADEVEDILSDAEHTHQQTSSLYPMVQTLVNKLSIEERANIIELMWRVAFVDGHLDKYEEATIRKVADLLYVPHPKFMEAKHRAL